MDKTNLRVVDVVSVPAINKSRMVRYNVLSVINKYSTY